MRIGVSVVVEQDGRQESGSYGGGGRGGYETYLDPAYWHAGVDEALRMALVNLSSEPAPAGEMPVVLGPGWPGVLLHEAIGHGLEGDFNRKKTSAFSGMMGQRVAAPGVTVVDDGTMAGRRGSLSIDDEGTPTSRTVLIEDGILKGYMQDRQNARLMGMAATGNGRRESYSATVMPRMTNTYMLAGDKDPAEIIASVDKGIYAVNFGGGQVDITNGKFVFSCTEAYRIENGKVGAPIKGATLIGDGPTALTQVKMIGNDMKLDTGVGVCGKNGQSVPVGVGQPTMRIDGLTVGGTAKLRDGRMTSRITAIYRVRGQRGEYRGAGEDHRGRAERRDARQRHHQARGARQYRRRGREHQRSRRRHVRTSHWPCRLHHRARSRTDAQHAVRQFLAPCRHRAARCDLSRMRSCAPSPDRITESRACANAWAPETAPSPARR